MYVQLHNAFFIGQTLSLSLSTDTYPTFVGEFESHLANCTFETNQPLEDYAVTWTDEMEHPITFNESHKDFQGVYPREFENKTIIWINVTAEGKYPKNIPFPAFFNFECACIELHVVLTVRTS